MKCPYCGTSEDKVVDSRSAKGGKNIRRRRECLKCDRRFTTYEHIEEECRVNEGQIHLFYLPCLDPENLLVLFWVLGDDSEPLLWEGSEHGNNRKNFRRELVLRCGRFFSFLAIPTARATRPISPRAERVVVKGSKREQESEKSCSRLSREGCGRKN